MASQRARQVIRDRGCDTCDIPARRDLCRGERSAEGSSKKLVHVLGIGREPCRGRERGAQIEQIGNVDGQSPAAVERLAQDNDRLVVRECLETCGRVDHDHGLRTFHQIVRCRLGWNHPHIVAASDTHGCGQWITTYADRMFLYIEFPALGQRIGDGMNQVVLPNELRGAHSNRRIVPDVNRKKDEGLIRRRLRIQDALDGGARRGGGKPAEGQERIPDAHRFVVRKALFQQRKQHAGVLRLGQGDIEPGDARLAAPEALDEVRLVEAGARLPIEKRPIPALTVDRPRGAAFERGRTEEKVLHARLPRRKKHHASQQLTT